MNNILAIIKDVIIAAVIAVLTSGLFKASNIIYQSIITVLVLVIIFLILRRIDKKAKQLEILSVLYVESLIVPLIEALNKRDNSTESTYGISNIKIFIVLPESYDDILDFRFSFKKLDTIELKFSSNTNRILSVKGKKLDNTLLLFDTPSLWFKSLEHLKNVKGMRKKKISRLLKKMGDDIKSYTKDVTKRINADNSVNFISLREFTHFYS